MNKRLVALVVLICLTIAVWRQWPDGHIHIVFCDVGQGDATLIIDGFTQLLVDGGPNDRVLSCLQSHMPVWDRTIETVVATHPDADHISGLGPVLKNYRIKSVFTSSLTKETADFESFKAALQTARQNQAKVISPTVGGQIMLSERALCTILHPQEVLEGSGGVEVQPPETLLSDKNRQKNAELLAITGYNNWSIVLFCTLDEVRVLLTGDLEQEGEKALIEAGLTPRVDVLKVGHHGSKSSSTPLFLDKIQPELAVISVGKKNRYGHPAPDVLDRLVSRRIAVLRTDELGTIELLVDGGTYVRKQQ